MTWGDDLVRLEVPQERGRVWRTAGISGAPGERRSSSDGPSTSASAWSTILETMSTSWPAVLPAGFVNAGATVEVENRRGEMIANAERIRGRASIAGLKIGCWGRWTWEGRPEREQATNC